MPAWPAGWRAAIIGCGSAGSRAARLLIDLGVPASALCGYDRSGEAHRTLPSAVPFVGLASDVKPPPDLASAEVWFVCTPAHARANYLDAAVRRAVPPRGVFVEKPFASCALDAYMNTDVVAAQEAYGIIGQVGYCWRWHPAVEAARAWLAVQRLERTMAMALCAVDMDAWGRPETYRGDALLELSHELDTVYGLLGPGRVVSAIRSAQRYVVTIQHGTGAVSVVVLDGAFAGYARRLTLVSDRDAFTWETDRADSAGRARATSVLRGKAALEWPEWTLDRMYAAQYAAFLRAVIDGAAVRVTWRDGLYVLRWCDDVRKLAEAS